jgi:hypothetical protein
VDAAGLPEGVFAIRAENWREMVAMAVRAGLLPEQMQGTVEGLAGRRRGPLRRPGGDRRGPDVFERADLPRAASRGPRAAPEPALAAVGARTVGRHVEMEVIAVEPVGIWAKHRAEGAAGGAVRLTQDAPFAPCVPVGSAPSVRCHWPDRSRRCRWRCRAHVRSAAPRSGIACPAGVGGHDPQVGDPAPGAADGGDQPLTHPCLQRSRGVAIDRGRRGQWYAVDGRAGARARRCRSPRPGP